MKDEKLPVWIKLGNAISKFFGIFEILEALVGLLMTFLLGVLISPVVLLSKFSSYVLGRRK